VLPWYSLCKMGSSRSFQD